MSTREVTVSYVNDEGEVIRLKAELDDSQIAEILSVMDEEL